MAKEDPTIETITFDLQKTLPLPRISTNVIFYKRQLWVYNLGIHTGSEDQAYLIVMFGRKERPAEVHRKSVLV